LLDSFLSGGREQTRWNWWFRRASLEDSLLHRNRANVVCRVRPSNARKSSAEGRASRRAQAYPARRGRNSEGAAVHSDVVAGCLKNESSRSLQLAPRGYRYCSTYDHDCDKKFFSLSGKKTPLSWSW